MLTQVGNWDSYPGLSDSKIVSLVSVPRLWARSPVSPCPWQRLMIPVGFLFKREVNSILPGLTLFESLTGSIYGKN